ncbi:GTP-binding protein [Skermania sp. ID1734]|uniref:CobW family GTP-binding protein n=1 Tax=Skermania sp. ID1734 TaxID=2597516 RepID=UPI00117E063F|nr:CobW family GTP-binding protein [Skermania sp. ID1734]TSE00965.1 GTP-binding protein [Skermania sp. ID1734]
MVAHVPVLLVAGFLGAGKTTLLNHVLRHPSGARIGVVVNDFGKVNIDAMLVAGQVDAMVSLGNGCVCCVVDTDDLDRVLHRLAAVRPALDSIVIEASGLAEPRALIRMVLGARSERIRYGGLVYVVDAVEFDDTCDTHPELARHARLADLVVINKADRVGSDELSDLIARVRALAGPVPVLPTAHGRVDPAMLFDVSGKRTSQAGAQLSLDELMRETGCETHEHLHDRYQSVEFSTDVPLDPRKLMAFLEHPPAGLFRAKGIVGFAADIHRKHVVHTVGRHVSFTATRWRRGEQARTQLVFIGIGLDSADVLARLRATEHDEDQPPDPHAMLRVDALTR